MTEVLGEVDTAEVGRPRRDRDEPRLVDPEMVDRLIACRLAYGTQWSPLDKSCEKPVAVRAYGDSADRIHAAEQSADAKSQRLRRRLLGIPEPPRPSKPISHTRPYPSRSMIPIDPPEKFGR